MKQASVRKVSYMAGRTDYKKRVLDFINQKGLDLSSPINRSSW